MFSVQKKDFIGQWVEVYRTQMFLDAERFKNGLDNGSYKIEKRIVRI